ncbi:MAG: ABC transporter permease [Solirubrobacterales bacterium]|nr:ABC transporter permease [Solirubrobacterales bacterium]
MPETLTTSPAAARSSSEAAAGPGPRRRRLSEFAPRLQTISTKAFVSSIGLIVLAAAWQILPSAHIVDPAFITPLSQVISTWWHMLQDGSLWSNTSTSLLRAAIGFFAAVIVGVPLGLVIGANRRAEDLLSPVLELFRNTAPLALLPVFILILGIGQVTKFVFVGYACLFPILLNTIAAVRTVDPLLVKAARVFGYSQLRIFQKVVLPASVPQIFTGIRLAASYALLVLIAAEYIGANSGLGFLIDNSEQNFQTPMMYAAIITMSLIGVLINFDLLRIERRLSTWRTA